MPQCSSAVCRVIRYVLPYPYHPPPSPPGVPRLTVSVNPRGNWRVGYDFNYPPGSADNAGERGTVSLEPLWFFVAGKCFFFFPTFLHWVRIVGETYNFAGSRTKWSRRKRWVKEENRCRGKGKTTTGRFEKTAKYIRGYEKSEKTMWIYVELALDNKH